MIKIILIAVIGTIVSMILNNINSKFGFASAIVTGIIIIGILYDDINNLVNVFKIFGTGYGVSDSHIKLLIKILGISYITQFGASVAEECGEKFIAKKIEFAGKIFIISLSVPVLINLLNSVTSLI